MSSEALVSESAAMVTITKGTAGLLLHQLAHTGSLLTAFPNQNL